LQALALIVFSSAFATLGLAKQVDEITWEKLIPPQSESVAKELQALKAELDRLGELDRSLFYEFEDQDWLRRRVELGFVEASSLKPHEQSRLAANYESERPKLFSLWQRVQEARVAAEAESEKINASLDGQTVRIPGYLLPLETEGLAVREFLLVPFVGACIHVPPPPANQMVYVKLDQPYESEALFEAVWVEGVLSTDGGTHNLSYVDGQSDVNTGYAMQGVSVSKHTK